MGSGDHQDTIIALSSGQLPSGIAVIRVTGSRCKDVARLFSVELPSNREAKLCRLISPMDGSVVDEGLVLFFENPHSFSGEDLVEFQLHGSLPVVQFILDQSVTISGVRLAEAGEFTRRSFENGKLDLTRVEGIGDLLEAQTESQRALAVLRMKGGLSKKVRGWRADLVNLRAEIEARLDFSDEEDVPFELPEDYLKDLASLKDKFAQELSGFESGKMIREGIRVALVGKPNVGKSSLLNALARTDTAIVTSVPGTTRDVVEVDVSIEGHLFRIADTAGIRETTDEVELIGIERSRVTARNSDLVLALSDDETLPEDVEFNFAVATKLDSRETAIDAGVFDCAITTKTPKGHGPLMAILADYASQMNDSRETLLISHSRDKYAITDAKQALERAATLLGTPELLAEELRTASHSLSRLLGEVGTEDVLDRLFEGFCIGK